jgi:hypothetical protein
MDVALVDALASGETRRSDDDLVALILATAQQHGASGIVTSTTVH